MRLEPPRRLTITLTGQDKPPGAFHQWHACGSDALVKLVLVQLFCTHLHLGACLAALEDVVGIGVQLADLMWLVLDRQGVRIRDQRELVTVGEVGKVVDHLECVGDDSSRAVLFVVDRVHRADLPTVAGFAFYQESVCIGGGTSSNLRSNIFETPFLHISCTRR